MGLSWHCDAYAYDTCKCVCVCVFEGNSRGRTERFQYSMLALCHAWLLGLFVWNNGHTGNTWTHWQMISGSQTSFPEVISHFLSQKHTRTQPSTLRKPQKTLCVDHIQILSRPTMVSVPHVKDEVNTECKLTHFTFIIHILGLIVNDSLVKLILKKYVIIFDLIFWGSWKSH